jgi:putative ABC transport system permease protein
VFYLSYLGSELLRRKGKTILTLLGLSIGVALVIVITGLTHGLDHAQKTALNPLASIGTDLTVTRTAQQQNGFGGGNRDLVQANQSVLTDLSKLGKPGQHFVHDFFLPGSQLTFPSSQTKLVSQLKGVAKVSSGLTLTAVHQEGTVPKIVATLKTQAKQITVNRNIAPPTQAEAAQIQACIAKLQGSSSSSGAPSGSGTRGGGRNGGTNGQGGFQTGQGSSGSTAGPGGFNRGAFSKCLPARLQHFRGTVTDPSQTLRQVLNPPQTNITSTPYTIGGVDLSQPGIGLVTPAQVSKGRFLSGPAANEALVSSAYASKQQLSLGSTLDLNGSKFKVVGLISPPLGGQSADVYLPLGKLQTLAGQKGESNVMLVRADSGSDVSQVQQAIEKKLSGAQVASSKQAADQISGSLVSASNLSRSLGLVLAILAAVVAFLIAALVTLSSVGKRVRELGTLKAMGWSKLLVVRQVVSESLLQGFVGGILGVGIGVIACELISAYGPSLSAHSTSGGGSLLGVTQAAHTVSDQIALKAPLSLSLILLGFGIAVLGGLLAGLAGALRASRLRPADALRQVE